MGLISIIMPVRNARQYVADAVRSVLAQTGVDLEVVVVDDGSTDGSAEVIRAIGDSRFRIIPGPRDGISAAMNAGLAAARGEWFGRCDADDLFPTGRLAHQADWLGAHPEYGAICGSFRTIDAWSNPVTELGCGPVAQEITDELASCVTRTHLCTFLTRTEVARKAGGFRKWFETAEDIDLMLRLGNVCRVWYDPAGAYLYRLHDASITHTQRNVRREFFENSARTFQQQRRETGSDDLAKGHPPTPPPATGEKMDTLGAAEHVQEMLMGASWRAHRAGRKLDALRTGWRACLARPGSVIGWKSLISLAVRKSPRPQEITERPLAESPPIAADIKQHAGNARPLVSILMPVCNAERFIAQSVQSALSQTFRDFELIAIDDGSTDASLAILQEYARKDTRIRLVSRPNVGLVKTLNEGIALARGEFLARFDADDLCEPRRLELQMAAMQADPQLLALGSAATAIDSDGRLLGDFSNPLTHEEIERRHLTGYSSIHHPAAMLRTQAVRHAGGYRELVPCEDFDLWLRLGEMGRLGNLSEALIHKRLTVYGLVGSNLQRHDHVIMSILADVWKRRGLEGAPKLPERRLSGRADLYRQWGWMALKHGQLRTSRHYAFKALASQPFRAASWQLVACALRGR